MENDQIEGLGTLVLVAVGISALLYGMGFENAPMGITVLLGFFLVADFVNGRVK